MQKSFKGGAMVILGATSISESRVLLKGIFFGNLLEYDKIEMVGII